MTAARARALITRPVADARPFADLLAERGFDSLVAPMLEITFDGGPAPALDGIQALLFTSRNGVRAFARASDERDLPAFAVGASTADLAQDAGFSRVVSADGDVDDLARRVAEDLDPAAGSLLHVAGSAVAGDLSGDLTGRGFDVRRAVMYQATAVTALPRDAAAALEAGAVSAAFFFSPRTAATFDRLIGEARLRTGLAGVTAYCLSAAVAQKLEKLGWGGMRIAERPDQASLLDAVDADLSASQQD